MRFFFSTRGSFIILICLLFLSLRLITLPSVLNFGSDAARDFLVTWQMYETKHPVLIGPPSEYTFHGRQFFFGPAPYYLILPALLIGHWDPIAVSYFLIVLNLAVLVTAFLIMHKSIKEKAVAYYFGIFCACTPLLVTYSQSYWNPYFMLPVSMLLVALLVHTKTQKKSSFIFLFIGLLFGLGLQFHYSFLLAIIVSIFWLFISKKMKLRTVGLLIGGFLIGFFPVILFELRNHFYNMNTLFLILTHPADSGTGFIINSFYLISLLPFLFYLLSVLLIKIKRPVTYMILAGYILLSVYIIFSPHMNKLSYSDAKQIAAKIERDHPTNFNVVDQLTGDNRATVVRYLVTVQGFVPLGVTQYPQASTLYVYSKLPLKIMLKNPVWEIASFLPYKKITTRQVADQIVLYKLQK